MSTANHRYSRFESVFPGFSRMVAFLIQPLQQLLPGFIKAGMFALVVAAFTLLSPVASAQIVIDTTSFLYEDPDMMPGPFPFEYNEDQHLEDENYIPEDFMFVPVDVLYSNRWDTLYIRTGMSEVHNMKDSVMLLLNIPEENDFCFPFRGKLLSKYGPRGSRFHAGMDIKLELNDTVKSAWDGKVRIARTMSGYGKMVVVRHNNGLETLYGHLSKILVDVNQEVKAGEVLGLGGRTGRATTTHLHFETRFRGEHFNPAKIIDFENYTLTQDTLLICRSFWKGGGSGSSAVASSGGSGTKYHTIRSGDTLSKISRRYGVSVNQLCKINGIKPDKILRVGSRLRVS